MERGGGGGGGGCVYLLFKGSDMKRRFSFLHFNSLTNSPYAF